VNLGCREADLARGEDKWKQRQDREKHGVGIEGSWGKDRGKHGVKVEGSKSEDR
jgi:hypothetical protein